MVRCHRPTVPVGARGIAARSLTLAAPTTGTPALPPRARCEPAAAAAPAPARAPAAPGRRRARRHRRAPATAALVVLAAGSARQPIHRPAGDEDAAPDAEALQVLVVPLDRVFTHPEQRRGLAHAVGTPGRRATRPACPRPLGAREGGAACFVVVAVIRELLCPSVRPRPRAHPRPRPRPVLGPLRGTARGTVTKTRWRRGGDVP